jgi:eukaryotic-like serine/threonine-protein kinase
MKSGFWRADWFLGLVVVVFMLFAGNSDLLQSLERKAYDMGVQATSRAPSDKIAVIAIDEVSLANIGRWPWSRDKLAKMIDLLAGAKAKVVGNTVLLSEAQIDPGYQYIQKLLEIAQKTPDGAQAGEFVSILREAEQTLNTDRKLGESFEKAGNVVQAMLFEVRAPQGRPDKPLPDYVTKSGLSVPLKANDDLPPATASLQYPIEPIGRGAAFLGHLNQLRDVDGAVRSEPLVLSHFDQMYPSLATMIVAKYLNLQTSDIKISLGQGVTLQNLHIKTDPNLFMSTYFYKDRDGKAAFQVDSFYDVISGKIPAEKYRDKIVLIGATAAGLGDSPATPISASMPSVLTVAHAVSSILQEHFFVAPSWGWMVEKLVFLLVAAYLVVLLPRLKAGVALGLSAGVIGALIAAHFALMTTSALWLQLMVPATLLLIGHAALVSKRFIATERGKQKSDESSAESNRMLGLAYQGQGQLDLAWDKFRQVPLSEGLLDNLYNLALDFERKRQFNKAESVFKYMFDFNPKFKDLQSRLSRAKQLSETVMFGASGAGKTNTSILGPEGAGAGTVEKPMLGRYQVEKELGKGAMGVVYLGKDPKIGRVVAIKTMALSQEFEAEELTEVKERFFREAETAGRLSHPNIVTIYDAGEEHDLCYIAMELLKGGDLVPFSKAGNLLPAEKVVSIVARAAEALGYAHRQGVVHRDIKPANMMYHSETDTLKVTDFGIARLTDSSKTKTGMVLGTPSFMSPEQLAGKKIEGRSDLFSLAVSLYQMLSGKLPFEGESMAQLMFKIANEAPTDIRSVNPGVAVGLAAFLETALAKDPDQRLQTGEEFAGALRASLAGAAAPAAAGSTVDIQL